MADTPPEDLIKRLDAPDSHDAWREFLDDYSPLIYQVIRHFENDLDQAADCFQFVCERLLEDRCKRLRRFKGEGTATFHTWLRAVVRNLCIDWHRREFGRRRPFRSVSRLSPFDQEVFKLVYERGIPLDETLSILFSTFKNVSEARVVQSKERIESVLTANQRWRLSQRFAYGQSAGRSDTEETERLISDVPDPRPNPEAEAYMNERRRKLARALANMSTEEKLLIRMRFEQELTLDRVAQLLHLGNAQRVDRQLKELLARLREQMDQ